MWIVGGGGGVTTYMGFEKDIPHIHVVCFEDSSSFGGILKDMTIPLEEGWMYMSSGVLR